jgi:hypothetical protein
MNRLTLSILLVGMLSAASAQIEVGLEMMRNSFIRGEPVEVTVTVRNLAGKDVMLSDEGDNRWFGFQIMRGSDTPLGPFSSDYKNKPQVLLNGTTMRRSVDLLRLYPVNEYGTYTIRAAIYFQETGKYVMSGPLKVDISEGRKLWTQTVGVPASKDGAGDYHVMSLLTFPHPKEMVLYARIEDEKTGTVFATYPLGRIVSGTTPGHEFDRDNSLYVLHMSSPEHYLLSKIGVNGEWTAQTVWESAKGNAILRAKPDGKMVIVGATRAVEKPPGAPEVPKLSDRPMVVPK